MGVIHDKTGPVVLLQCRQSGQRTNIPIHAEYAVRHNEALPFAGNGLQQSFQIRHIAVPVDCRFGF